MHNYYSKIKSIENNSNQSVISKDFHGIDPLTETYKNNYNKKTYIGIKIAIT